MNKDLVNFEAAVSDIADERARQNEKWGQQNHDAFTWLAILTEEVGELAQSALHDRFGGHAAGTLGEELVQVAAVAVQWLEQLKREETAVFDPEPSCRICGCTDEYGCPAGCYWVEPDLCSRCAGKTAVSEGTNA